MSFNQTKWIFIISLTLSVFSFNAEAIPSFARQTGVACSGCHTSAFGPSLTPFGRRFKLDGYTLGDNNHGIPPISGMLLGSFTHTNQGQPRQEAGGPSSPAFNSNNNFAFDEASIFYGGRVYGPVGAFAQFTYDGVANTVAIDNIDLRYARAFDLFGSQINFGISLNNNPTVQDLWNTTPAWGFPFASSPIAPAPSASPLIAGGLSQQVGGGSFYALVNDLVYLEAGAYGNFSVGAQKNMGAWSPDNLLINGGAPYWRLALQKQWAGQYLELGAFGMQANGYADRYYKAGGTNHYNDVGADFNYQYLGTMEHIAEFRASYIRENQTLDASQTLGLSDGNSLQLNSVNLNGTYTYAQTYSANFGFFNISGSTNSLVYADNSRYSPYSQGFITEFDYIPFGKNGSWGAPWANLRVGLQYVAYTKLNGTGAGAAGNNTLFLSGWLAF